MGSVPIAGIIEQNLGTRRQGGAFCGWPAFTLLESGNIPIEKIAELALREGQSSNPLYRVHRWFARRVGSQFRSIITALSLHHDQGELFWDTYLNKTNIDGAVVLDPFMGGGTSLVESMRCNGRVIGFDIDPVATFITRFELLASGMEDSYPEIKEACRDIAGKISSFHMTIVDGQEHDVLHHFWVQVTNCSNCRTEVELHPHFQLAYSREKDIQWVFCKACHAVHELPLERKVLHCSCGKRTTVLSAPMRDGIVSCPMCKHKQKLSADDLDSAVPPVWKLFAQEYLVGTGKKSTRHFKKAEMSDYDKVREASEKLTKLGNDVLIPQRPIPREGRSDGRPLIHGIRYYSDLFNDRQKLHLHLLAKRIQQVRDEGARKCLEIAFSEHLATTCMYTAYAFGYRRTSPMFSIHSYRHITRPVELNPWQDGIGRGTFINVVNKISKAIAFAKSPIELHPDGSKVACPVDLQRPPVSIGTVADVLSCNATASVETRSSEDMSMFPDKSVDLILTDPPYFDNLSYSELSDFYLAWHQVLGIAPPPYDNNAASAPITQNLAIARRSEDAIRNYQERLQRIFSECNRVLSENAVCVFTYHHKLASAWEALGTALAKSGLRVTKVLPMRGEGQGGLHTYDGTIKWDAVLVCRKGIDLVNDGTLVISRSDLNLALEEARRYNATLSLHKRVGFKEPDFVNLVRALVISKSLLGEAVPDSMLTSDVLRTILPLENDDGKVR